jgi:thiol-disulfide isomerase/thioredoxin
MRQPRVRAPEFPKNQTWLNTDRPLSLAELKGRIVLLDFWTYCCINCTHILPDLKYLEQKYKDTLTVIGVHSAKFDSEKETENIRQAILRYDIEHPVVVDSNLAIWQQYAVRSWPTLTVIDPQGYVIASVSGEGHREVLDELIEQLICQHKQQGTINFQEVRLILEKHRQPLITPLAFPGKVLADETGNRLFIADSGHHRLVVTTLDGEVSHIIGTGIPGLADGCFQSAQFSAPQGMALDAENQILYVADTGNHALRRIELKAQRVETIAGTGTQTRHIRPHGGRSLETPLNSPWDLQLVGDRLYVAMAGSHQIWEMQLATGTVQTYVGTGAEGCADGSVTEAAFAQPSGITAGGLELFVADSEISSIRGVSLGANPAVRTVCGSGELFGFGDRDGTGTEVRLQHCLGVEYAGGFLWIADSYNHKIKKVDTRTGVCYSVLGDGTAGLRDGRGAGARFSEPAGLSAAGACLYIADTNNHAIRRAEIDTMTVTALQFPGLCAPDICVPV